MTKQKTSDGRENTGCEGACENYDIYAFDLDGTLLNTLEDLYLAVNATMRRFGRAERSKEEVRAFVGNGIKTLVQRALCGAFEADKQPNDPLLEDAVAYFKEYYGKHMAEHTQPYAGVEELLAKLKAAGKKVAVVSNKANFAVKKLCEEYFGTAVDFAAGENEAEGIRKKPAPDVLLYAIEKLGGGNALYIGDSEVDVETAKNAKVPCVSVCWGFKDERFLKEHGATKTVFSAEEIF